jgi:hypothetical protein
MEPLSPSPRGKMARKLALSERALADLARWAATVDVQRSPFNGRRSPAPAEAASVER